uniref:Uncharacterized protein n=1 Tax=Syphacia muris TaxID=451379 RepID=A0A0N5AW03_9BILA
MSALREAGKMEESAKYTCDDALFVTPLHDEPYTNAPESTSCIRKLTNGTFSATYWYGEKKVVPGKYPTSVSICESKRKFDPRLTRPTEEYSIN